ncbi:MAG: hypothetical protein WKG06_02395 [Segetibacter sp.]
MLSNIPLSSCITISVYGSAFNSDETKLLINSNSTGIDNVYELNINNTSVNPLTKSTKGITLRD